MHLYNEVSIILVSYKSNNKVFKYIQNISKKIQIIVVENSNNIELKNKISKKYKNVKVILSKNIGYGAAANLGSKFIKSKYFILSNPDIEGINIKIIKKIYNKAIKIKNNFLSIGPRINITKKNKNNTLEKVKKISGSFMFFSSKTFNELNGFDENIFLYFEEDDICKRGNKKGLNTYIINNIKLNHIAGSTPENLSINEKKKIKKLLVWHFIWSKFYYYNKHYGKILSIIIFLPIIIRIVMRIVYYKIINNSEKKEKYEVRLSGLVSSILGIKSYKRTNLDNL
jgi:N-acetylglucosaminyl-diphospho-decaprenol L-rhamnosyltransferase